MTVSEREVLERVANLPFGAVRNATAQGIGPLLEPVRPALVGCGYQEATERFAVQRAIVRGALHLGKTPQGWTTAEWMEVRRLFCNKEKIAFTVVAIRGYGAVATPESGFCQAPQPFALARRLFGPSVLDGEFERMRDALSGIGFCVAGYEKQLRTCVAQLLLQHGSPSLDAITDESLTAYAARTRSRSLRKKLSTVSHGLAELGITRKPLSNYVPPSQGVRAAREGVPETWVGWCERWRDTAVSAKSTRDKHFQALLKVGRWLARDHPSVTSPADWTLDLALAYVRYVDQSCIGDFYPLPRLETRAGEPMAPNTKMGMLSAVRVFFHQLQEWGWIERRLNPSRAFPTPRQVTRAAQYNPRPIDDGHWLKLRAAALTLQREDLPLLSGVRKTYQYPLELARAVAATWVFSGCRANEIERLEVGCTYIEHVPEQGDPATGEVLPAFDQAMLRVPVSKTSGEFVKPIEEPMAHAILMTAFHKSSNLTETLRTVAVLVDGRPEPGQPVLRYDLGHGWCTNPAYAMCAHRMACARCSFYEPAAAFANTLAQQKGRYVHMLQQLDLTDDERAAVTGDADACERLVSRLAEQPTPDGASV